MADDQKSKTMDINDLVRELSKSSTAPVTPPPAPASQSVKPSFPPPPSPLTPKPPMSPPMMPRPTPPPVTPPVKPPEMPKPQFSVPPKPAPMSVPSPTTPPPTPGVKEYQSSIRTMNEDISKIKQGQQPIGVPVPRKVEQVIPASPVMPSPAKPAVPTPRFKVPSVNLGEAQKTGPLAQTKPGPMMPPSIPSAPTKPKIEPKPQIYVPQEAQPGGNRNMLFIGIGAVAIVAGFAYWFFVLRSPAPEVVLETPTPTPTVFLTPTPDLGSVLVGLESNTICTGGCTVADFVSGINTGTGTINGGQFKKIYLTENDTSGNVAEVFDSLVVTYPGQLKELLGTDSFLLIYGQKETFDSKGLIKTDAIVGKRLVFISEAKDMVAVSQLVQAWETEMADNLKTIFQFDPKKQERQDFSINFYKETTIRYKNFPYADRSIDYSIVRASNLKSYLVITNSREAMYATVDKLKGP